ncbi:topoisomerase II-associated protein PAT1-domain-containing protein [Pisolithus marmoratus]|nr:topoisomerase II-associated protein PAT1-domain-containing protein [Pisolithus marmoratus]
MRSLYSDRVTECCMVVFVNETAYLCDFCVVEAPARHLACRVSYVFLWIRNWQFRREKKKFLEAGLQESEDLAVYTWGDDSYDGLGDALVEGGDELNDETFGGIGEVGKDFDFTQQALPGAIGGKDEQRIVAQEPARQQAPLQDYSHLASKPAERVTVFDASPFTHKRVISSHRSPENAVFIEQDHSAFACACGLSSTRSAYPAPIADTSSVPRPISRGITQTGARTLQEIEAEMRLAAQAGPPAAGARIATTTATATRAGVAPCRAGAAGEATRATATTAAATRATATSSVSSSNSTRFSNSLRRLHVWCTTRIPSYPVHSPLVFITNTNNKF